MRRLFRKLHPARAGRVLRRVWHALGPDQSSEAYSQEGEDLILKRLFTYKPVGFYVDIGAHHPSRLSNTYLFYRRGWRGINVDAMPGSMEPFRRRRPRDINLEAAVGRSVGESKTFWMFNEPALNTFDEAIAKSLVNGPHRNVIINQVEVTVRSLADILQTYLPEHTGIDFLTIDVEGMDYEVLLSNVWERFRPSFILAECTGLSFQDAHTHPTYRLLVDHGYEFFAKTVNTFFFCAREFDPARYMSPP